MNKKLVKSLKCLSCHSRTDSWEEENKDTGETEVTIICAHELDRGVEEVEKGDCDLYLPISEKEELMPIEEVEESDNLVIEEVKPYTFEDVSLIEVVGNVKADSYMMRPSFVERYNAMVDQLRSSYEAQIRELKGRLEESLKQAKAEVMESEDPSELDGDFVEEMFLLEEPDDEDWDEEELNEEDSEDDDY